MIRSPLKIDGHPKIGWLQPVHFTTMLLLTDLTPFAEFAISAALTDSLFGIHENDKSRLNLTFFNFLFNKLQMLILDVSIYLRARTSLISSIWIS
jgi:hypothetical protein